MKNKYSFFIIGQVCFVIGILIIVFAREYDFVFFFSGTLLGLSIVFNTYAAVKKILGRS